MRKLSKKMYLKMFFLSLFIVLVTRGYFFLDPDFGWHNKMGEIIMTSGIPRTDPFSFTMASFPFVDHEWLTNVWMHFLYSRFGMLSLSTVFTLIFLLSLYLSLTVKISEKEKIEETISSKIFLLTFLIGFGAMYAYFGVRPQIQSWLLFAVLINCLLDDRFWLKFSIYLPILFLLWTNLHGSFGGGFLTLFVFLILRFVRTKKIKFRDLSILVLSFVATLVNPYGIRAWGEVYMQMSDTRLHWSIQEWQPPVLSFDVFFIIFLTFSIIFITTYRKLFRLEQVGLFVIFSVQAITTSRHVPLWVVIGLPMLYFCLNFFYLENRKKPFAKSRFEMFLNVAIAANVLILLITNFLYFRALSIVENRFYPLNALNELRKDVPDGNIFAPYEWGGYMIWKLPEKKVFIDGRMPSWRWKKNQPSESAYAFDDYMNIISGEVSYKDMFEKYNIKTVLWTTKKQTNSLYAFEQRFENQLAPFYKLLNIERPNYSLTETLEKDGWKKTYEDKVAVIFESP